MKRMIAVAALGVASVWPMAGIANADPIGSSRTLLVELHCDNGSTYDVVVAGNGLFTPAHDLASSSILVPTSFGEFHGVITDAEGNVVEEFTDPAVFKGSATKDRATSVTCTFEVEQTFEIPELGVVTLTGDGSVTGFVTPAG
ncbi:hypothetical protein ACIBL3_06665 [Kribbella sp. NPDC050124]|uniref:hypothetical protein n=1 Tax=Kribbella sp. NPDC050124 TaxID=3364114 RepID=UPI0037B5A689